MGNSQHQHLPLPVILIICSIVHFLSSGYSDEPTPNIHVALEDGNVHKRAFSFAELLKIQQIFVIHFNRKPITDIWTPFNILSAESKYELTGQMGPLYPKHGVIKLVKETLYV